MMPMFIKDFTWRQTPETVSLTIKIKGVRRDKTSFVTSDNYIRCHYPPYFFEIFLWGEVDDQNGKCTLNENDETIIFEMPKLSIGQDWPMLDLKDLPRTEKYEKRTRAVEISQQRSKAEIEAALARRHEHKQMTVHEQIRLDDESRQKIAAVKGFYTRTVMEQFNEWKAKQDGTTSEDTEPSVSASPNSSKNHGKGDAPSSSAGSVVQLKPPPSLPVSKTPSSTPKSGSIWTNQEVQEKATEKKPPAEAPIRTQQKINVSFTPREFPTPSRESTADEEAEWLKKQVEARRMSGFNDADLKPEENNPTWLYEKGESLLDAGSYLGAISAYTTGLKLAPKMPELYCGRASAHLALSNIRKAVEDASQGLELLTPKVPQNAQDRLRCHKTRGLGLLKLKMKKEAMFDYREAIRLDPNDQELKDLVSEVQAALDKAELCSGSSSSDSD